MVLAVGCQRRPLEEQDDSLYLRLNLNLELECAGVKHTVEEPELMRVVFYDPETMAEVSDDYVRAEGGYINARPGNYKMLVYNFDTEATLIKNHYSLPSIEAYTGEIPNSTRTSLLTKFEAARQNTKSELVAPGPTTPIVYEPDHLFVARQDVEILRTSEEQVIEAKGHSIVEMYYIAVRLLNKENLASAQALISGQVGSNKFGFEGGQSADEVILYFNMRAGEDIRSGEDVLWANFQTFGKLPEAESRLWLTVVITGVDGSTEMWQKDITDEFENNPDHYIYIEEPPIDVPDPPEGEGGGGGFQPSVGEWEEVHSDIYI